MFCTENLPTVNKAEQNQVKEKRISSNNVTAVPKNVSGNDLYATECKDSTKRINNSFSKSATAKDDKAPQKNVAPLSLAKNKTKVTTHTSEKVAQWGVQVAAFLKKQNASAFCKTVSNKGFDAFVVSGGSNEKNYYRVRVNGGKSRSDAALIQKNLVKQGFEDTLICHLN